MRTTIIRCDKCREVTDQATTLEIQSGPTYGMQPPLIDLCLDCWRAFQSVLMTPPTVPNVAPESLTAACSGDGSSRKRSELGPIGEQPRP